MEQTPPRSIALPELDAAETQRLHEILTDIDGAITLPDEDREQYEAARDSIIRSAVSVKYV